MVPKIQSGNYNIYTMWRGPKKINMQCNVKQMNNVRKSLPDNTNRHTLILTHSLSSFTFPRCALYSDNPGLWDIQLSSRDFWLFCEIIAKVMSLLKRLFLGFWASHELCEDGFGSRLQVTTLKWPTAIQQASHATNTAQACSARFHFDKRITDLLTRQTDRQTAIFTIAALFSLGENTRLGHAHTDTQHGSCVDVRCLRLPGFVPRIRLQYAAVFPAFHAIVRWRL